MEGTYEAQLQCLEQINKFCINYKKTAKDKLTKEYIEARYEILEAYWKEFHSRHMSLSAIKPGDKEGLTYFKEEKYDDCLETYLDVKTRMKTQLAKLNEKQLLAPESSTHPIVTTKLPPIHLPTFAGDYKEWLSFRDLYKSLVHDNPSICKVNKCQYLKSSLQGEAANVVKQMQVSESNYDIMWAKLNKRFNNKRSLVNTYIEKLLNQKKITTESPKAIREILDTTTECLETLKGMDIPTDHWDDLVVHVVIQRLPPESHDLFERTVESKTKLPTWSDMSDFLEDRFFTLEAIKHKETPHPRAVPNTKSFATGVTTGVTPQTELKCSYCKGEHLIYACKEFCQLELTKKKDFVQRNSLCFNCLKKGHSGKKCLQSTNCRICGRKHHSLLHGYVTPETATTLQTNSVTTEEVNIQATTTIHTTENSMSNCPVILTTALVDVRSEKTNHVHTLRALVDQGSQACLITEEVCQLLGSKRTPIKGNVTGVGSNKSTTKAQVEFDIKSKHNQEYTLRVNAYILSTLTSYLPQGTHSVDWPQLEKIELADPTFYKTGKIDLILGAEVYAEILQEGIMTLKTENNTLLAQRTTLGWLISGKNTSGQSETHNRVHIHHIRVEIDTLLRSFWEIEENTEKRAMTNQEIKCEKHFETTHTREEDGRYRVRLPFTTNPPDIGESYTLATKRLAGIERKFKRNQELETRYNEFMKDYLQQQHMEAVKPEEIRKENNKVCYLPHHAVVNEQHITTKLRVVFDSSAKTSNDKSLNDNLMVGPALQNDLRDVTLRWRRHEVVLVGDIRQMYRQITVDPRDRDYLRILFRFDGEEMKHYRLTTVTYGTSCAPYLAIKTLKQLAEDERQNFSEEVIETALQDFYIDDLLTGQKTLKGEIELKEEMTKLLQRGGFQLHKWASNHTEIEGAKQDNGKILGINWNGYTDKFELKIELPPVGNNITKRTVLCDIAKIYDPAAWLAPVVVVAKTMLQKLWLNKLEWDETLPEPLMQEWLKYRRELMSMPTIELNRWIGIGEDTERVEIHGFCDASTVAYAAVVYCRVITAERATVTMLEAKSRVAPVKQISLPRLELCGAVLLAKLIHRVQSALSIPTQDVYAWTDATIVLAWLQRSPSYWATFVANRVTEITNLLDKERWHHVTSQENPADVASRGISPVDLPEHELWWSGPTWLREMGNLPVKRAEEEVESTELEKKASVSVVVHSVMSENEKVNKSDKKAMSDQCDDNLLNKYSNLNKLIRVVARILRFVNCLKHKIKTKSKLDCPKYLTTEELQMSLVKIINISQRNNFEKEMEVISQKSNGKSTFVALKKLENGNKIVKLNPFVDENNLLRVGGRIEFANVSNDVKHPVILSKNCMLSNLIVRDAHYKTLHGGVQLMLNYIRAKYHIIGVKHLIKNVIHKCVSCVKHSGKVGTQLMGNLPKDRVTPQRPFKISGVDFAGPITLKLFSGRGSNKTQKAYIAVFVCTCVKAVHLELVTSLSTEGFMAAFRRFTARRGHCCKLLSDRGTNFVGASKELKSLFDMSKSKLPVEIADLLAQDGTEWQFNPAGAPHMGGIWEAAVKSTKSHLNRVLNDTKLTYEEYSTLLCQVESCLNSRPLSAINEDDGTSVALTPGHFLIGETPIVVPDRNLEDVKVPYLQRWTFLQQKLQSFWRKWSQEYLVELQKRNKWTSVQDNIVIGSVVLIKDERLPPSKWLLGKIVDTHAGNDGLVRVVSIRCKNTVIKRPIHKLCLLPTDA